MRLSIIALSLALFAIPSLAQHPQIRNSLGSATWPEDFPVPTAPLLPAAAPNPLFPFQVKLTLQDNHFNYFWSDFRGNGKLLVGNTLYNFSYECPDTFLQPSAFQARWSKDGKKLDILLQNPKAATPKCAR